MKTQTSQTGNGHTEHRSKLNRSGTRQMNSERQLLYTFLQCQRRYLIASSKDDKILVPKNSQSDAHYANPLQNFLQSPPVLQYHHSKIKQHQTTTKSSSQSDMISNFPNSTRALPMHEDMHQVLNKISSSKRIPTSCRWRYRNYS